MSALRELDDRAEVCVGGLVTALRTTVSSKGRSAGQPMAMFRVLGPGGGANAVIFPRSYQRYRELLRDDAPVILRATLDRTRDEPALLVNEVLDIADPAVAAGRRLLLEVRGGTPEEVHLRLDALREILPRHPGPTETYLVVEREAGRLATFRLGEQHRVALSVPLLAALEETLGAGRIHAR